MSIVTHSTSRGAQASRNSGILASSGTWVTFLDSDDRYLPDSIMLRMEEAERRSVAVVHGEARRVAATGIDPLYGVPRLEGNVRRDLLAASWPLFPALLVRRDVLVMIGYLDESIIAWQEWDTALRLSRVASFGFVPVATFDYDERHRSQSRGMRVVPPAATDRSSASIDGKSCENLGLAGSRTLPHHGSSGIGRRSSTPDPPLPPRILVTLAPERRPGASTPAPRPR